jgi:EmrB/QacA subfamily drug resistance transporter
MPGEALRGEAVNSHAMSDNGRPGRAASTLLASLLGFFMVTFDAVVVNVALPTIRRDLGGGISGLQWVVDGYTLMFAAFLLASGALSDRIGAKRAFGGGTALFVAASAACSVAPSLAMLVVARFAQGAGAAVIMPASMALITQAYPDPRRRAHAVAMWATGSAVASSSAPLIGGLLALASWRLIFIINVPAGAAAIALLLRAAASPRHPAPFDWTGQVTGTLAMGALTYGTIEAGGAGFGSGRVVTALVIAAISGAAFLLRQHRAGHPMVPLSLFRSPAFRIAIALGFTFMVGYYGVPFVMTLDLQQVRGYSPLLTGVVFAPMMWIGLTLTPLTPRLLGRFGQRPLILTGLLSMCTGVIALALLPATAPAWLISVLLMLAGLAGPLVMPPTTGLLLSSTSSHRAGIASGVFNTSRQVGGALAVAVFGALLAEPGSFIRGMRLSLLIAAAITALTALGTTALRPASPHPLTQAVDP